MGNGKMETGNADGPGAGDMGIHGHGDACITSLVPRRPASCLSATDPIVLRTRALLPLSPRADPHSIAVTQRLTWPHALANIQRRRPMTVCMHAAA